MGSLIEQAIIDANELREAALRSAESQIIEKYSSEIKEAMDSLLDEGHGMMDMPEEQIIVAPNAFFTRPWVYFFKVIINRFHLVCLYTSNITFSVMRMDTTGSSKDTT